MKNQSDIKQMIVLSNNNNEYEIKQNNLKMTVIK